ncbi:MAG: TonB-dependent receptor [Candidatus Solibacter usitatus]|nr:TonB-dependent receptor [Candidatus Solibacter usitatus]
MQIYAVVLLLLLPGFCRAQNLYGSLTGNITDSTDASVPGAKVAAVNTATGVSRQSISNERGVFNFNDLQPGPYRISVISEAFTPFRHDGIAVEAGVVQRLDVRLKLATISETITVEATASVALQTDRADVNMTMTRDEVENLPLDGQRNYQSLYKLLPGFTPPEELHSDAGNPQRAMGTNVNGASYSNNNTRIDGATVSYPWLPHIVAYVPAAEAIQTVNVITNSFDAEQGMAGGAAMNVTIKSGTNQFHGSAWEYHQNSALKARNYFYCLYTCSGDPNHPAKAIQNQYGGTLGGPIRKNKLFFFASWEATKRRNNASGLKTVATPALKRGDFSTSGTNIFDPETGTPDGKNREVFAGRIIPANRFDPASVIMASMLPEATLSGVTNDYFASASYLFNRYNADFKVNYNPTSRSNVFVRYGFSPSDIFDPPTFGMAGGDALSGGQPGHARGLIQNASMGGTYTLSPTVLLDGHMGFTRLRLTGENIDLDKNYGLDVLHIPGTNGTYRLQAGIPRFTVTGFSNFGNPNVSNPFLFRDNQYTGIGSLSWMRGAHSIRFGAERIYYTINHFQPQTSYGPRGGFNFTGGSTALNGGNAPNTYNGWADFLLGLPNGMGKDLQYVNPSAVRMPSYGLYIRDQWQVNRRLTVNYGTRWEYYPFATRDHRGGERYDPVTDKILVGGVGGVPTSTGVNTGHGQLAPRLGVAWRVNDKTVLRGGYGVTIDPNSFRYLRDAYPSVIALQITGATTYQAAGTLRTGLPAIIGPDLTQGTLDLPRNVGDTTFPENYNRGHIHSWNITLQREIRWGFSLQAGYVASRAIRQTAIVNLNAADSVNGGNASRLLAIKYGRTADIKMMMPFEDAAYDSMQSRILRRMRGGGTFGFSFTYSKALNSADNSDSGLSWNGPSMWSRNRGQSTFNRPQNMQIYFVQPVPFGRGRTFFTHGRMSKVAGGWQLNGTFSRTAGRPFTIGSSATSLNSPGNAQTGDQVKEDVEFFGGIGRGVKYFDPTAFAAVSTPRFGNTGRNILFGPGLMNMDASLFRSFKLREKINSQFRWEMFNVTNTPAFGQPAATVTSGGFAEITSASGTERRMRFALKFTF